MANEVVVESATALWHPSRVRLDIDSLRTLQAIVESGSFTAAAARLHLTQSAVSWKIKRLEERLGHALLVRDGKSVELTEMGRELLLHADKILAAHDEAIAALELRELTGTVRLDGVLLCETNSPAFQGRDNCGSVYRNPEGTAGGLNEYTYVNASTYLEFSAVE